MLQLGIENFDTLQLGLPYVWTQRIAGLNFSSEGGNASAVPAKRQISQISLPETVATIKKRLRARIALCNQLQSLGKLLIIFVNFTHLGSNLYSWPSLLVRQTTGVREHDLTRDGVR